MFSDYLNQVEGDLLARAGEIGILRNDPSSKPDGSYVTAGDLLVQEILIEQAHRLLPDALIVSEELTFSRESLSPEDAVIVIDPIDGTENFTSGLPEWGVSVSCYKSGVHRASLLLCPEMGQSLASGRALLRKGKSRIRALSSALSKEDLVRMTSGHEYRIMGCCVYNMLNVIRGAFQSFENPKGAHSWDILAGLNLALEHELCVTVNDEPYQGEYLPPDGRYRFKVENR